MIMGDKCTRRCTFCDVAHGRPEALDAEEPRNLGRTIAALKLKYVVITSVDRDDLKDGGAQHFVDCIRAVRELSPSTRIEVLVPDFRGRLDRALDILEAAPPDVMNHNLETAARLYPEARPGSDYRHSLQLLQEFKRRVPGVPTKSGLMVGLGETDEEIIETMRDLRAHDVDMLTVGQYLSPSGHHMTVRRYVHPDVFVTLRGGGEGHGLHARGLRADGALELPRRPAGGTGRHSRRLKPRRCARRGAPRSPGPPRLPRPPRWPRNAALAQDCNATAWRACSRRQLPGACPVHRENARMNVLTEA